MRWESVRRSSRVLSEEIEKESFQESEKGKKKSYRQGDDEEDTHTVELVHFLYMNELQNERKTAWQD